MNTRMPASSGDVLKYGLWFALALGVALVAVVPALARSDEDRCSQIAFMSKSVLEARQAGVPITKVIRLARTSLPDVPSVEGIIFTIYDAPGLADMAPEVFRALSYRWCLQPN